MTVDTELWRTSALLAAGVGQACFIALYATFPWWRSFLGRALFYKSLTLGLLTNAFLLARFKIIPVSDEVFIFIYSLLAVGVWWQFFAFLRVLLRSRRQRRLDGESRA